MSSKILKLKHSPGAKIQPSSNCGINFFLNESLVRGGAGIVLLGTPNLQRFLNLKKSTPSIHQTILKSLFNAKQSYNTTRDPFFQYCCRRGIIGVRQTWVAGYECNVKKSEPASEDGRDAQPWKLWRWFK